MNSNRDIAAPEVLHDVVWPLVHDDTVRALPHLKDQVAA